MFKADSDCSSVLCVCSVVCMLIKCLLGEIVTVTLQASFLFHQTRASTAPLNSILTNTRGQIQPAAPFSTCRFFPSGVPVSQPFPQRPSFGSSIPDPNAKRSPTFSAGNHAEPAGTFRHLSFHFELEMGLCSVFQAAEVRNTYRGPGRKISDRY